ncbi:unnamed protein product [Rotaria sordida]|uniref:PDZ domain-containing protein n=1 Tax=Rotaria sordida TaxID=392033 RepID=A0A814TPR4_9BILA|nr:unnamed protein product [Rotaria sordida]CAF3736065.1 unnamed protein product [Rotaria sordida]
MSDSGDENALREANLRLCRICAWHNYTGLGFSIDRSPQPPHLVQLVESNSPASAGGLRFRDVILAVNNKDVSKCAYTELTSMVKNARDNNARIELLVVEQRFYDQLKKNGISINSRFAKIIDTPKQMPRDYKDFPKNTPRTCKIRSNRTDKPFGFTIGYGNNDIGAYIQDIIPKSPASETPLRKSDRILEINDKFVDNESSETIQEKLSRAQLKSSVKLYVVDTHTYAHFQKENIPLQSKKFQKSPFAINTPTGSYGNIADSSSEKNDAYDDTTTTLSPPLPPYDQQPSNTYYNVNAQRRHSDDIRLCTITRADETDKWGFQLTNDKDGHYHLLKILPNDDNRQSNAELAGVKSEDHLIEINGENVEKMNHAEVKQLVRDIKHPQKLKVLVADAETFNYYKQQNKLIHNKLLSVKYLPSDETDQSSSSVSSVRDVIPKLVKNFIQPPVPKSSKDGLTKLVESTPIVPITPKLNSQSNRRNYELRPDPDFPGFGFRVTSIGTDIVKHKIVEILPNSPAEQQGLPVNYNIIAINNQNVEDMSAAEFKKYLNTSSRYAQENDKPLLLEVIGDKSSPRNPSVSSISTSTPSTSTDEDYPTIRCCVIKSWPKYPQLGFKIIQSRNKFSRNGGYQIQQLETNSPAAHTHIFNDDYIIQVNGVNIENEDYQYVQDLIHDKYRKDQQIELLVIDDSGYRWYKNRPYPIDPSAKKANVDRYKTPDTPPMDTPKTTNNIQPGFRPINNLQGGTHKPIEPRTNGYDSPLDNPYSRVEKNPNVVPSLYSSQDHLSRGTVDIVSEKRLLRLCRVKREPGPLGFDIKPNGNQHIIYKVQPNSPAARAGLHESDRLIEVNDENVLNKPLQVVNGLIKNIYQNEDLRLLIAPKSVKPLTKRSAKSLLTLNDDPHYQNRTLHSIYDEQKPLSSTNTYQSVLGLHGEFNKRDQLYPINDFSSGLFEPTDPWQRKCVLLRDSSFRGCGFRLTERQNCDTPIVVEVSPNSPAKQSGLTEGDHVIYIESQNIQNFRSFHDIIDIVHRTFEENGQITLIVLTGPGYRVLKRRGGYLDSKVFNYQQSQVDQIRPRLCKLKLYNFEYDFGFTLKRNKVLYIKSIEQGSSADVYDIKEGDVVLELNGLDIKYLSMNKIYEIIEISKQERKLDILVIDMNGYEFSMNHAIPLNSNLSFVQIREESTAIIDSRTQNNPVYL